LWAFALDTLAEQNELKASEIIVFFSLILLATIVSLDKMSYASYQPP